MTKYGQFMYNLAYKSGLFLSKHKVLYYILACTNGIIMTILGLIITLFLLCIGKKPKRYHNIYYIEVGKNWGGLEMGLMFLCSENPSESLKAHEYGHTFQNALFGPLFPILIGIPSAIRYWYRTILYSINKEKYWTLPRYDAIWFEGNASNVGKKVVGMV